MRTNQGMTTKLAPSVAEGTQRHKARKDSFRFRSSLCLGVLVVISLLAPAFGLPLYRDSLSNGLIVITYEEPRLPIAAVSLVCRSGAARDPKDKSGTAAMMADLLTRGTATMSGDSVKSIVEFLGARFSGGAADDNCGIDVRTLTKDLGTALDLMADAVLRPAFGAREMELARGIFDDPGSEVSYEFMKLLYGDHPYGRLSDGDTVSIPLIKREDLVTFHNTYFRPNNCFVVAVGDIVRKDFVAEMEKRLGSWTPGPVPAFTETPLAMPDRVRVKLITRPDMNQTYVEFGHPGIRASDGDMLATRLMSYVLGGGAMSSRLGISVREDAGLAYDVRCWFDRNRLEGGFHATVQTARPKEAIGLMLRDIKLMYDSGATKKELEKAHNYFTGSFPLTYASTGGKLGQVRTMELYGYGMDWLDKFPDKVRAVTLEAANKAARDHLAPGRYWMVILGPVTKDDLGLRDVEWIE
jgi:zinc protease